MAASRCWGCLAALACTLASPRVARAPSGGSRRLAKAAPQRRNTKFGRHPETLVWTSRTFQGTFSTSGEGWREK